MAYEILADVYDSLMQEDVDYHQWCEYCVGLFQRHGLAGNKILDLGCGTGNITIPFAQKGYQMTGVDLSAEMLEKAKKKAEEEDATVYWLCQDITQLQLGEECFDGVLATFDTLNYITAPADLQKMFHTLYKLLPIGGVFVFDINTEYKLRAILGDNIYTYYSDDVVYIWENQFDDEQELCYMDLTFFIKEGELYRRYEESHTERVYTPELLEALLSEAGFRLEEIYAPLSYDGVEDIEIEERVFMVAKKV